MSAAAVLGVVHLAALAFTAGNKWFRVCNDIPDRGGAAGGAPATPAAPATQASPAFDVNSLVAPVLQAVQTQVAALLDPIQRQTATLATQIEEMRAPNPQRQAAAGRIFGGTPASPGHAPGVRTGEDPLTSRGYQMYRALGFRQNALSADQCKVELDVHTRLMQIFKAQGFVPEGNNSILVPMSSEYLPGLSEAETGEIRQMMRAGVEGMDVQDTAYLLGRQQGMQQSGGMIPSRRQALSMWDDTGLGILLGTTQQGELIPMLRNKEVFSRAGATEMPLPPNGRLNFPKQAGAGTAYWVGESDTQTSSQPTTGYIDLIAKKLAVLTKLPNELMLYGSPTVEAFVRNDMTRVMALEADLAMLTSQGSTKKVKGLLTYAGVVTRTAGVTGSNGDTLQPEDLGLMLGDVEALNHDVDGLGWTWVCRSQFLYAILNKRSDVYYGASGLTVQKGDWLFDSNRDDVTKGLPAALLGHQVVKSQQVPNTYSKGSGTNLTRFIGGVFAHWIIARLGVMEFATSVQGDTAFQTDQTWVRCIQHIDAAPRYENAFVFVDTLLPTV